MHDVRSLRGLPPSIGLRSEVSRALQLQRLAAERRRLVREGELATKRQRTIDQRLLDLDGEIAELEGRKIVGPVAGGIEAPPIAGGNRHALTLEY
jgi:hypothetical protein